MNLNNPVDLAPVLSRLQQALNEMSALSDKVTAENASLSGSVETQTNEIDAVLSSLQTQTAEIGSVLEMLTAVNGELDNTATAVNQHTTSEADSVKQHTTDAVGAVQSELVSKLSSPRIADLPVFTPYPGKIKVFNDESGYIRNWDLYWVNYIARSVSNPAGATTTILNRNGKGRLLGVGFHDGLSGCTLEITIDGEVFTVSPPANGLAFWLGVTDERMGGSNSNPTLFLPNIGHAQHGVRFDSELIVKVINPAGNGNDEAAAIYIPEVSI